MKKIMFLIFGLCLLVCHAAKGQGKTLSEKIENDTISMNDMLDHIDSLPHYIDYLGIMINKYEDYYYGGKNYENIVKEYAIPSELYEQLQIILKEYETYFESIAIKNEINNLKKEYENLTSSSANEQVYIRLKKQLNRLRKKYKNPPLQRKTLRKFAQYVTGESKQENMYAIDVSVIATGLFWDIHKVIEEQGFAEVDAAKLKKDPLDFYIDRIRDVNDLVNRTDTLERERDILNEEKAKLDSINRTLQAVNDTISQQTKKLQLANDELVKGNEQLISKIKLTEKALQDARQKENEWLTKLTAYEKNIEEKKQIIQERESALLAIVNKESELKIASYMLEDTLAELSRQAIVATNTTAKMKADIETLKIEKAYVQAKQIKTELWRTVFLGSSVLLLFGLLGGVAYDRARVRQQNKRLDKEKAEKDNLNKKLGFMLKELNHRTKNNLQIISSIADIQILKIKDSAAKEVLLDMKKRIHTIGIMHKGMYTEAFDKQIFVKMGSYIDNIVDNLKSAFEYGTTVSIHKAIESNISIHSDKAIPLGLIINEVMTNSFKYAFLNHPNPALDIQFKHIKGNICLMIKDNGKATPEHPMDTIRSGNMGSILVDLLSKELDGKSHYSNEDGLKFTLKFPTTISYDLTN